MNYPKRIIKEGEADTKIVKAIQQKLIELNIGNLEGTGVFGAKTKSAVKLYQAMHRDSLGNPLTIDGQVGSITWQVLFGDDTVPQVQQVSNLLLNEAVSVAQTQVGVMENPLGSNRGKEIDAYDRCAGVEPGPKIYWCASFVYWCFNEAAKHLNKKNPLYKTAGCLAHWNNTTGKKISRTDAVNNPSLLKPGVIFILDFGHGMGHTGIIESIEAGFIHTIEGNSNDDGSRNGIGVFQNKRKINSISKGFIEYK